MPALVFLLMLTAMLGMTDTRQSEKFRADQDDARAVATQLAFYHSRAVGQCGMVLPPATSAHGTAACNGVIVVNLGTVTPGGSYNYATRFRSVTDGDWVVTAYVSTTKVNADARHQWGLISAGLRQVTLNSVAAGPYDGTTGRINNGTRFYTVVDGAAQSGTTSVAVPPGLAALLGLVSNMPVIATRAR